MWAAGAGFAGLVVAALPWLYAFRLVPDSRGRPFASLTRSVQWELGTVALVGGAAGAAAVAAALPERPATVAFAVFAAVTPGLAVVDSVTHRLPFAVSGGLAAVAAVGFGWDALDSGASGTFVRAGWAALVVGGVALVWWRLFDGGLGLGDVALLAVIGLYCGWWSWAAVWGALILGFALAALGALVARWRAGSPGGYMPLGPWLLAGCWAAIALAVAA